MEVHIGKIIKDQIHDQRIRPSEFAKMLGIAPLGVSRIFHKQHIHSKLLVKISEVLKHDFFRYYSAGAGSSEQMKTQNDECQKKNSQLELEVEKLKIENDYLKQMNKLLMEKK